MKTEKFLKFYFSFTIESSKYFAFQPASPIVVIFMKDFSIVEICRLSVSKNLNLIRINEHHRRKKTFLNSQSYLMKDEKFHRKICRRRQMKNSKGFASTLENIHFQKRKKGWTQWVAEWQQFLLILLVGVDDGKP